MHAEDQQGRRLRGADGGDGSQAACGLVEGVAGWTGHAGCTLGATGRGLGIPPTPHFDKHKNLVLPSPSLHTHSGRSWSIPQIEMVLGHLVWISISQDVNKLHLLKFVLRLQ